MFTRLSTRPFFLAALAATGAAVLTGLPSPVAPVWVVGAGAVGLETARLLTRCGRNVIVLETSGRVGGRSVGRHVGGADLRLRTAVRRVAWDPAGNQLATDGVTLTGSHVVVTVSLDTLRNGSLAFDAARLTWKRAAIQNTATGTRLMPGRTVLPELRRASALAEPIDERALFAGDATVPWVGEMANGALDSARRASAEVLG